MSDDTPRDTPRDPTRDTAAADETGVDATEVDGLDGALAAAR